MASNRSEAGARACLQIRNSERAFTGPLIFYENYISNPKFSREGFLKNTSSKTT